MEYTGRAAARYLFVLGASAGAPLADAGLVLFEAEEDVEEGAEGEGSVRWWAGGHRGLGGRPEARGGGDGACYEGLQRCTVIRGCPPRAQEEEAQGIESRDDGLDLVLQAFSG